jgi:hypothetical protein
MHMNLSQPVKLPCGIPALFYSTCHTPNTGEEAVLGALLNMEPSKWDAVKSVSFLDHNDDQVSFAVELGPKWVIINYIIERNFQMLTSKSLRS